MLMLVPATAVLLGTLCAYFGRSTASTAAGAVYRNARWIVGGVGSELVTNLARPLTGASRRRQRLRETNDATDDGIPDASRGASSAPTAVVTGATGGIGTEICVGLVERGYHVFVAARDRKRGEKLAERLRGLPSSKVGAGATFVEYRADRPVQSAKSVASSIGNRAVDLLVNNAGTMGGPKRETIVVNLLGPIALTLALLPSLGFGGSCRRNRAPTVVNVGSSAHLRASRVDPSILDSTKVDSNLSAYAQSKLGLMQFSTIMRNAGIGSWLNVVDVHPGLVWTPLIRSNLGGPVSVSFLERTGLSKVLYKDSREGATTVLVAAAAAAAAPKGERRSKQLYFVNCRVGGYASGESRNIESAGEMWSNVVRPVVREVFPNACSDIEMGLAGASLRSAEMR